MDRLIEKIVEVPVEKLVEKIVEVPVEKIVEKIVIKEVRISASQNAPVLPPGPPSTAALTPDNGCYLHGPLLAQGYEHR